jgi:hypothetical protein
MLERDFLSLLEFSPEVKNIDSQLVKIDWSDADGVRRSYMPDAQIGGNKHSHLYRVLGVLNFSANASNCAAGNGLL